MSFDGKPDIALLVASAVPAGEAARKSGGVSADMAHGVANTLPEAAAGLAQTKQNGIKEQQGPDQKGAMNMPKTPDGKGV